MARHERSIRFRIAQSAIDAWKALGTLRSTRRARVAQRLNSSF